MLMISFSEKLKTKLGFRVLNHTWLNRFSDGFNSFELSNIFRIIMVKGSELNYFSGMLLVNMY